MLAHLYLKKNRKADEQIIMEVNGVIVQNVKIQKFLSTWWVSRVLKRTPSTSSSSSHHEVDDDTHHSIHPKLIAVRVNVHLLLKWIKTEISENVEKVIFIIENEEDLIHMVALTEELRIIMGNDSSKPELKAELAKTETFLDEDPCWPSRWIVHIIWKSKSIPKQMRCLRHVELIKINKCELDVLPHFIGHFQDLKVLDVECNNITYIPSTLQLCTKLEELKLMCNQLVYLPALLFKLPNLQRITRFTNRFEVSTATEQGCIHVPVNNNKVIQTYQCDTLRRIAAVKVASNLQIFTAGDVNVLDIPKTLKESVFELLSEMSICSHCNKGVETKDSWKYQILVHSCLGYRNIPMIGEACSYECAVAAHKLLVNANESYMAKHNEEYCYDIDYTEWIGDHSYKFKRPSRTGAVINSLSKWVMCGR